MSWPLTWNIKGVAMKGIDDLSVVFLLTIHVAGNNMKYTYSALHVRLSLTLHNDGHIGTT
jgi:hypothetical protein